MTKIIRQLLDCWRAGGLRKRGGGSAGKLASMCSHCWASLASKKQVEMRFPQRSRPRDGDRRPDPGAAGADELDRERDPGQRVGRQSRCSTLRVRAAGRFARIAGARSSTARAPASTDSGAQCCATTGRACRPGCAFRARVRAVLHHPSRSASRRAWACRSRQDIVDEHGGWLAAESEPGRGSRFVLFLPRRRRHRERRPDPGDRRRDRDVRCCWRPAFRAGGFSRSTSRTLGRGGAGAARRVRLRRDRRLRSGTTPARDLGPGCRGVGGGGQPAPIRRW